IGNSVVRLTCEMHRVITNVSASREPVRRYLSIDDWGIEGHETEILEYEAQLEGDRPVRFQDGIGTPERGKGSRRMVGMPPVLLEPNKTIRMYMKYIQYKHINDQWNEEWLYPTHEPEIQVRKISDGLVFGVSFGHPSDKDVVKLQDGRIAKLPGTLMP